ncbi:3-dehydroquinate synthase [Pollutibacter soli]|uniref:3-dehydroquinate synthase n=1 Tax=Pollutibacter soli TaxID=3034157 RepID=UPI003013C7C5
MNYLEQRFSVQFNYKVFFTSDLFAESNKLLENFLAERKESGTEAKILFVLDEGLVTANPSIPQKIRNYFSNADSFQLVSDLIIVPGGEAAKNNNIYFNQILEAVHNHGIDRHSYLIAVGGGAVLDLAGYAAAVAHRGIKHIRVPGTVLSQNDSGVGVKNGINYFGKKNFLGSFVPPVAVFNDEQLLLSLDTRNWRSGISEAIKVALIKDADFFYWIEDNVAALKDRNLNVMNQLVKRCAELHLEHISGGDPFELGSSRPLDFGHWSAHKLEQLSQFTVLHGEAVAMGIALDTLYSAISGRLDGDKAQRIIQLIRDLGFEITHPLMQVKESGSPLLQGLEEFREHLGGRLTIMLLSDIGKGVEVNEMDPGLLEQAGEQLHAISGAGYSRKVTA